MADTPKSVIRETDSDSIDLAKALLRASRYGALAAIDARDGAPIASRVGVATDTDGCPLILVSGLSAHTAAIVADPRCSLLLGEPGKGDPLAHPRITLSCRAVRFARDTDDWARAERRYLNKNPKAKLYVGLGDFAFFRLEIDKASLNGGFGKAYLLGRDDLVATGPIAEFSKSEQSAVDHMNEDHPDAIANYAMHWGHEENGEWRLTGYDPDGIDLALGDRTLRIPFGAPLSQPREAHMKLVEMAKEARIALGERAAKASREHSHS